MLPPVMAVNGPANGELEMDMPLPPSPPYSPLHSKSPPGPGPVSPGKKRVRISDSTSVRVIEDPPPAPQPVVRHRTYYQQFNSAFHGQLHSDSSPRIRKDLKPSSHGDSDVGRREGSGGVGEYDRECEVKEYCREYPDGSGVEVQEFSESLIQVDQLTFPGDVSSTIEPSLESRDNPFLPGGDLSREAEDLLSKATIVRDKFFLDQQRQDSMPAADPNLDPSHPAPPSKQDVADGALPNDSQHPAAVEERITPTSATRAEATPEAHPRENGKASDGLASPDGVRVEVGGEGVKGMSSDSGGDEQDKDKRRPKCCVVM